MNEFIILSWLERVTGIEASSWVLFAGVLVAVANVVTKRIPADSTGWWGKVRSVTGFIGLVMSSRVTGQTTTMDVVKTMTDHGVGTGDAKPVVRNIEGKFTSPKKPDEEGSGAKGLLMGLPIAALLAIVGMALILFLTGCATTPEQVCHRAQQVKVVADSAVRQCEIRGIY